MDDPSHTIIELNLYKKSGYNDWRDMGGIQCSTISILKQSLKPVYNDQTFVTGRQRQSMVRSRIYAVHGFKSIQTKQKTLSKARSRKSKTTNDGKKFTPYLHLENRVQA